MIGNDDSPLSSTPVVLYISENDIPHDIIWSNVL